MSAAVTNAPRRLPMLLPTGAPVNASMSKTDLLLLCQWWASPRTARPKDLGDRWRLEFGIAFHKCMELWLLGKKINFALIAKQNKVPDAKRLKLFFERLQAFLVEMFEERGWTKLPKLLEQKMAYDPFRNTARFLTSKKERDYSGLKTTELPGTGDLAFEVPDANEVVTIDYKTGVSDYDAAKNGQLKSLGMGLALHYKRPRVRGMILRIDEDFVEPYEAEYDAAVLEKHRLGLVRALREALSQHPPMRPGTHCQKHFCPALEICPAHAGPMGLGDRMHMVTDRSQLGPLYAQFQAAKKLMEKLGERFKEEIEMNGPFEAAEDRGHIGLKHKSKRNLSEASIRRALGAVDGNDLISQLEERDCIEITEYDELHLYPDGKAFE